jgi:hypothetical protein
MKGDEIANLSLYISAGEESKNEEGGEPIKKKRKWRKCKATTPEAITKPGSYYHIINTYMHENIPHVLNLGSIPTMAALDSRKFLHKEIYDKLLSSYNDITNNAISGFAYPEVEYF